MTRVKVTREAASGGIGLQGALFLACLVLKLLGKIDWSWWWVTAPLWLPLAIGFGLVVTVGALALLVVLIAWGVAEALG